MFGAVPSRRPLGYELHTGSHDAVPSSIEASTLAPMITIDPPSPIFPPQNRSALTRFLNRASAAVGLTGEVHILLTDDPQIKRLNKQFRNKNKPTDILSFPAHDEAQSSDHATAGDLAISLETAARQASEHAHPLATELKILILHGLLHLAGEDHETDSGEMAARETILRKQLKLPIGLIERAA